MRVIVIGLLILLSDLAVAERTQRTNSVGIKLNYCKPGEFLMGSPRWDDLANPLGYERTAHVVISSGFYLGQHEVTQKQWTALMKSEPWKGKEGAKVGDNYPATFITWEMAAEFCRRLSIRENLRYRLPTEAEWEYACRAGTKTRFSFGNDPSLLDKYEWWKGNLSKDAVGLTGKKLPNKWGFHDMHSNATEWCADYYRYHIPGGVNPYQKTRPRENPDGIRVLRGGKSAEFCRVSCRDGMSSKAAYEATGFRIAMEP